MSRLKSGIDLTKRQRGPIGRELHGGNGGKLSIISDVDPPPKSKRDDLKEKRERKDSNGHELPAKIQPQQSRLTFSGDRVEPFPRLAP